MTSKKEEKSSETERFEFYSEREDRREELRIFDGLDQAFLGAVKETGYSDKVHV